MSIFVRESLRKKKGLRLGAWLLVCKPVSGTDEEVSPVTTEKTTEKTGSTTEKSNKTTEATTEKIIRLMRENPQITNKELAAACGITEDGVYWNTKKLKKNNIIRRIGGDKGGHWEVLI